MEKKKIILCLFCSLLVGCKKQGYDYNVDQDLKLQYQQGQDIYLLENRVPDIDTKYTIVNSENEVVRIVEIKSNIDGNNEISFIVDTNLTLIDAKLITSSEVTEFKYLVGDKLYKFNSQDTEFSIQYSSSVETSEEYLKSEYTKGTLAVFISIDNQYLGYGTNEPDNYYFFIKMKGE